jgi:serine/threonine protein kinase
MFAVKVIDKRKIGTSSGNCNLDGVLKEAEMIRSLRHPNIIHLEDIFENDTNIFLVMELSLGGDLFDRLYSKKYYREDEARKVMKQILEAIAFLHSNNIAHRDLKPENILLTSRNSDVDIKIIDFGLAKKLGENGKLKTICGTPQYFAPEVLQQKNNELGSGYYSLEADMWSLGVMLYVLLSGQYPFISKTGGENALFLNITNGQYSFDTPIWTDISNEAKILIRKLLVVEASQRLTAKEALLSNWILGESSEEDINITTQNNERNNENNNNNNSNDTKSSDNCNSSLAIVSQYVTNNDSTDIKEQENENQQTTMRTRRKQAKHTEENKDSSLTRRSSRKKSRLT